MVNSVRCAMLSLGSSRFCLNHSLCPLFISFAIGVSSPTCPPCVRGELVSIPLPVSPLIAYHLPTMAILDVLMRFLHIVSAVIAVGGAFLMLIAVPAGLKLIDDATKREEVLLRIRRVFKMFVHPAILFLLISGIYNTIRLWPTYKLNMARHHAFWGPHLVLGLLVMGIAFWLLAGHSLRKNHRRWLKINVTLMLVTILLASTLRYVRLDTVKQKLQTAEDRVKILEEAATQPTVRTPAITSATTQPAGTQ